MKQKLFVLHDRTAATYTAPNASPNQGQAIRDLSDAVNNTANRNLLTQHPEDISLLEVGEFDTDTGINTAHPVPILVVQALQLVNPTQAPIPVTPLSE